MFVLIIINAFSNQNQKGKSLNDLCVCGLVEKCGTVGYGNKLFWDNNPLEIKRQFLFGLGKQDMKYFFLFYLIKLCTWKTGKYIL